MERDGEAVPMEFWTCLHALSLCHRDGMGRDDLTEWRSVSQVPDSLTASRYTQSGMELRNLFNVSESLCMDVLESPSMRALSCRLQATNIMSIEFERSVTWVRTLAVSRHRGYA